MVTSCSDDERPPTGGTGGAAGMGGTDGTGGMAGTGGTAGMGSGSSIKDPEGTSVFLQILDQATGMPIPTCSVTPPGAKAPLPTDGAGQILLENLTPGRVVARVEASGYAPASFVANLPADVNGGGKVYLMPLGEPLAPFNAETGTGPEGLTKGSVRLIIYPKTLMFQDGAPVTGPVEATIVPLDPTTQIASAPGPLEGKTSDGKDVGLDSFAVAEISLWQDGMPLQLIRPGSISRIRSIRGLSGTSCCWIS